MKNPDTLYHFGTGVRFSVTVDGKAESGGVVKLGSLVKVCAYQEHLNKVRS